MKAPVYESFVFLGMFVFTTVAGVPIAIQTIDQTNHHHKNRASDVNLGNE